VQLLKELANDAAYLAVDDRKALFDILELTWPKLGGKGRKECVATIALAIQEHIAKKNSLVLGQSQQTLNSNAVREAVVKIDNVYAGIAEEARKYVLEAPVMVGLKKDTQPKPPKVKMTALDKLSMSYNLISK
jgi:hypothetical protein